MAVAQTNRGVVSYPEPPSMLQEGSGNETSWSVADAINCSDMIKVLLCICASSKVIDVCDYASIYAVSAHQAIQLHF